MFLLGLAAEGQQGETVESCVRSEPDGADGDADRVTVSNECSFVSRTPADRKEKDLRVRIKNTPKVKSSSKAFLIFTYFGPPFYLFKVII